MTFYEKLKTRVQNTPVFLLFFTTCFFFAPIQLYVGNINHFLAPIIHPMAIGLILSAVGTLGASTLAMFFPDPARKKLVAVVLALSASFWIQGNILVWPYGLLDGQPIDWGKTWVYSIVDGCLWAGLIILSWAYSEGLHKFARRISIFFIIVQAISLTLNVFEKRAEIIAPKFSIDAKEKFNLSKTENVILIILDEFQSDIFNDLIVNDENLRKDFDGFTYYPDSLSGACNTELAVPFILTGQIFDNTTPYHQFLKKSFLTNSVSKILIDNNSLAELYPLEGWGFNTVFYHDSVATNFKHYSPSPGYRKELREFDQLMGLAIFRYLPNFLKKGFWAYRQGPLLRTIDDFRKSFEKNNNSGGPPVDTVFFNQFSTSATAQTRQRVFKYYHLQGLHSPLDPYFPGKKDVAQDRANNTLVAKHLLSGLAQIISRLKQIGAYDNSLLMIIGDHGSGRAEDMYIHPGPPARPEFNLYSRDFQFWKARGISLVLLKPFNSHGRIRMSNAPVSLGDIPKTITAALDIPANLPGKSILTIGENEKRIRHYAVFRYTAQRHDYFYPIALFRVNGPVSDDSSWEIEKFLNYK